MIRHELNGACDSIDVAVTGSPTKKPKTPRGWMMNASHMYDMYGIPTFTMNLSQMKVSIPYMDGMGMF